MVNEIQKAEYQKRIQTIQNILKEMKIDIFVAFGTDSEPQNVIYLSNFWPAFETASVVIPVEGDAILVIGPESRTFAMDYSKINKIRKVMEHRESSEPEYPGVELSTYKEVFHEAMNAKSFKNVAIAGVPFMYLPVYEAIRRATGKGELIMADDIMINLRIIKSRNEIELMKRSAHITMKSFEALINKIKPGMEEVEAAGYITGEMFHNKAENLAYAPYILSGRRTSQAIGRASHKVIKKGEPIQVSCGCRFGNYSSSVGRPFCIGNMPVNYKRLVETGIELQKIVIGSLRAGIKASTVFQEYWNHIQKSGFSKYFLYGPCHGTGIMENEHPFLESESDYILRDGMAFQVDIFLGNENYGMRFEDGIVVRDDGVEEFTTKYREIIEL
jgi:Xaa-Pro aminopeptidase